MQPGGAPRGERRQGRWSADPQAIEAPAGLTREDFLRQLVLSLAYVNEQLLGMEISTQYVNQVGLAIGSLIEQEFRSTLGTKEKLTPEQYAGIVVALKRAIKGDFFLVESGPDKVVVGSRSCPFETEVRASPSLCRMTSSVFGGIAARNFGYGKVVLRKRIALGDPGCEICVYLQRVPGAEQETGDEYTPETVPEKPVLASQIEAARKNISLASIVAVETRGFAEERRRANQLLRRAEMAEKRYRLLFEGARDGLFMADLDAGIKDLNAAACDLIGYPREDALNLGLVELLPPEARKKTEDYIERLVAGRAIEQPSVWTITRKDGRKVTVEVTLSVLRENGGPVAVHGIARDITEKLGIEQRLRDEAETSAALLRIAEAIGTQMSPEAVVLQGAAVAARLSRCSRSLIFAFDEDTGVYHSDQAFGLDEQLVPVFRTLQYRAGKFRLFDEIRTDKEPRSVRSRQRKWLPPELVDMFGIATCLAVPVLVDGRVHKIILVYDPGHIRVFTDREVRLLTSVARQVEVALENYRLYLRSLERAVNLAKRVQIIETMGEIDRTILSTLSREGVLRSVTLNARRLVQCEGVCVTLFTADRKMFEIAETGPEMSKRLCGSVFAVAESPILHAVAQGRVFSSPNLSDEERIGILDREFLDEGYYSVLAVPLAYNGRTVGGLHFVATRIAAFGMEDIGNAERIARQASIALKNAHLFEDLRSLLFGTIRSLAVAIEAKDPYFTHEHLDRVPKYAISIARKLDLRDEDVDVVKIASYLHDVGKIGIPEEAILLKRGPLTKRERRIVEKHSEIGARILSPIQFPGDVVSIVEAHHERYDGTGYPRGLRGVEIPLGARILAIVDAWEAMISDRPYRKALSIEEAVNELKRNRGSQFDPDLADLFLEVLEQEDIIKAAAAAGASRAEAA